MALGPLFVHSSSHSLLVRRELAALGIAGSFEFICGSDWQSLPKPDPQSLTPILDLLRHGGYAREHCTYVGDAPSDLALAAACHIDFVGAGFTEAAVSALRSATRQPTVVATSMDALVATLRHRIASRPPTGC